MRILVTFDVKDFEHLKRLRKMLEGEEYILEYRVICKLSRMNLLQKILEEKESVLISSFYQIARKRGYLGKYRTFVRDIKRMEMYGLCRTEDTFNKCLTKMVMIP